MRRALLWAGVIAAGAALWVGSGWLTDGAGPGTGGETRALRPDAPMRVQVRRSTAETVRGILTVPAETEADRTVPVKVRTTGRVAKVPAEKGDRVAAGDVLVRLAKEDRPAAVAAAEAAVTHRKLAYEAARKLEKKKFRARLNVAEAKAALAEARSRAEQARLDLAHTVVRAPFAGVVETRAAEPGDYVAAGTTVATVVDLDPLVAVAHVSERNVDGVAVGRPATVDLVEGDTPEGVISHVASTADPDTRTFRVEAEIPNPDQARRAGTTAEMRIRRPAVAAHRVSPALLALNDAGRLGVKTVTDDATVAFHPVAIVRHGPDAMWVTGLPREATLITVGMGAVRAGDRVRPVPADDGDTRTGPR